MTSPAVASASERAEPTRRRGSLALVLQEALTAIVRLRMNRQTAADAESFRAHLKQLLATADDQARRMGYGNGEVKRAIYAVTVFLDESVLNSPQPMFAEWPRKPLQEEIFGGHMGGEMFFTNLRDLLARPDSEDLADLLEVHELCLLLGFRGRYTMGDTGELRGLLGQTAEKIQRIRGGFGTLAPNWAPPQAETVQVTRDPWLQRLLFVAGGAFLFALLLFLVFKISLGSGVSDLETLRRSLIR
ncbi:MAG TPA: DotU family type IV/VI secretion system protein [Gemmatimonadales bacterium]|nr:DotU family type IV/VI secretion system protein [Gemmatimonadales bacterium]